MVSVPCSSEEELAGSTPSAQLLRPTHTDLDLHLPPPGHSFLTASTQRAQEGLLFSPPPLALLVLPCVQVEAEN